MKILFSVLLSKVLSVVVKILFSVLLSKVLSVVVKILFYNSSNLNSIPNDNISDWSKFKAFAIDKINVAQMLSFDSVFDKIENIVGKGENAGYRHFLHFPHFFQKASSTGSLKAAILW